MAASSEKVMGRPLSEKQNLHAPIRALEVMKNGQLRPLQYVNEKGDVRRLSGQFLLSVQRLWEQRGDEILHRVADEHPALVFMAMVKIAAVQRIEVGQPDDFSGLKSKQAIVEKLEERAGPEARKLFETFIKKVEALEDEKGENGSGDR
jgi:hypothetical protein